MKKHGKAISALAIILVAVISIGTLTGGATASQNKPQTDEEPTKIIVETVSPMRGDIVVTGEYIGTVDPNQQVVIYPKVSAEVLAVHFHVGDTVEAGDVLFDLDATTLRNGIAQTQATITNAKARADLGLEMARQSFENYQSDLEEGYNSGIMQAEAAVKQAEIALQQANAGLRSARNAYDDYEDEYGEIDDDYALDAMERQLKDGRVQAGLQVNAAQLMLEQAEAALVAVKKQVADGAVTVEANMKSAQLATDFSASNLSLQEMQNNLKYYTVTSPISGIVEQKNVDPYDMAVPQLPAYIISNKDAMTISYQVSETTWENTQIGDTVRIEKNGLMCDGTVIEISTMVGAANGLYTVKVSVENAPFHLNTGTSVKVFAQMQKAENVYTLPIDAVYFENGSSYVYVYDYGIARKTDVVTGIADKDSIEILSGLTLNDQVVITWYSTLMDGVEIALLEDMQNEAEEAAQSDVIESSDEQAAPDEESEPDSDQSGDLESYESSDAPFDASTEDSDTLLNGGTENNE